MSNKMSKEDCIDLIVLNNKYFILKPLLEEYENYYTLNGRIITGINKDISWSQATKEALIGSKDSRKSTYDNKPILTFNKVNNNSDLMLIIDDIFKTLIAFYDLTIDWYSRKIPLVKVLYEELTDKCEGIIAIKSYAEHVEERKNRIPKTCNCLAGHIAYCEGNYKSKSYNHMCLYDYTTGIAMKTPAVNNAIIYEEKMFAKPLPKDSVIAIDVEFYSSYEFVKGVKVGINFAARVVVMSKVRFRNEDKNKLKLEIIFHCLLNLKEYKFNKCIPKKVIHIIPEEHRSDKTVDRRIALDLFSNLIENNICVFANFESDFKALLNSDLPIPENFSHLRFYDIQKLFRRNSGKAVNTPIGLNTLSKLFLLPINEDKYGTNARHDPIIDASATLELFYLIPSSLIEKTRVSFDSFMKVIKEFNKQPKPQEVNCYQNKPQFKKFKSF